MVALIPNVRDDDCNAGSAKLFILYLMVLSAFTYPKYLYSLSKLLAAAENRLKLFVVTPVIACINDTSLVYVEHAVPSTDTVLCRVVTVDAAALVPVAVSNAVNDVWSANDNAAVPRLATCVASALLLKMVFIAVIVSVPLFNADPISFNVSSVEGAAPTNPAIVVFTRVVSASNVSCVPALNVENVVEIAVSIVCNELALDDIAVERDVIPEPRDTTLVESVEDSVESTAMREDVVVDNRLATDATPELRLTVLLESAADSVESTAMREDVAVDSEVATDATPDTRDDALVESASDSVESIAVSDDTDVCREVTTDSTPEIRDAILAERAADIVESLVERANLDTETEFSSPSMSAVLAVELLTTAELTRSIMLCIIDPVDNSADISASVSSVDGAPPTSAMTAVVTALDIFTTSVLIAVEREESTAASDNVAV